MIVLGVYNAIARIPHRLRRMIARWSHYRLIPFDPVLRSRKNEPARREAWLRDQYRHPEEHRHTLREVQKWFVENDVEFVRAYPSALIGEDPDNLFAFAAERVFSCEPRQRHTRPAWLGGVLSHSHLISRIISFGDEGSFYRFYRCLKLDEPGHCSFIGAALVRFGEKLRAQSTLFDHSGKRL